MKLRAKKNKIQKLRIQNGYSLNGLARMAKVSNTAILRMEKGDFSTPSTAKKVSDVLNVNIIDIFDYI